MDSYDDLNLDSETAEKLLFHFGKFYSEEEIKIALGVLGNGRIITPDSLTEFLHDDVIQIDATATWTEYDLPKSAEKNRALGRAIRQNALAKLSSIVSQKSVKYQDDFGSETTPVKRSTLSSSAIHGITKMPQTMRRDARQELEDS